MMTVALMMSRSSSTLNSSVMAASSAGLYLVVVISISSRISDQSSRGSAIYLQASRLQMSALISGARDETSVVEGVSRHSSARIGFRLPLASVIFIFIRHSLANIPIPVPVPDAIHLFLPIPTEFSNQNLVHSNEYCRVS